jgi:hypothetical protein
MHNVSLPAPLHSPEEEKAFLDEIYRELEASGHTEPELTAEQADELERVDSELQAAINMRLAAKAAVAFGAPAALVTLYRLWMRGHAMVAVSRAKLEAAR